MALGSWHPVCGRSVSLKAMGLHLQPPCPFLLFLPGGLWLLASLSVPRGEGQPFLTEMLERPLAHGGPRKEHVVRDLDHCFLQLPFRQFEDAWVCKVPSPLELYFLSWNKARLRELPSEATLLAWLLCAADSHVGAWREALR